MGPVRPGRAGSNVTPCCVASCSFFVVRLRAEAGGCVVVNNTEHGPPIPNCVILLLQRHWLIMLVILRSLVIVLLFHRSTFVWRRECVCARALFWQYCMAEGRERIEWESPFWPLPPPRPPPLCSLSLSSRFILANRSSVLWCCSRPRSSRGKSPPLLWSGAGAGLRTVCVCVRLTKRGGGRQRGGHIF